MTKYIALTGGIGSGKSVISKIFSCIGIPVYDSDSHAKKLMESNQTIITSLKNLLGESVYENGHLNKSYMSKVIFSNKQLCQQVNDIVHPQVWIDYKQWSDKQNVPCTIMETALLYESEIYKNFDASIAVIASENVRIQRVMQRDLCDAESVKKRIQNQQKVDKALQKADFIIENNDTFVISQVMNIYTILKDRKWV